LKWNGKCINIIINIAWIVALKVIKRLITTDLINLFDSRQRKFGWTGERNEVFFHFKLTNLLNQLIFMGEMLQFDNYEGICQRNKVVQTK